MDVVLHVPLVVGERADELDVWLGPFDNVFVVRNVEDVILHVSVSILAFGILPDVVDAAAGARQLQIRGNVFANEVMDERDGRDAQPKQQQPHDADGDRPALGRAAPAAPASRREAHVTAASRADRPPCLAQKCPQIEWAGKSVPHPCKSLDRRLRISVVFFLLDLLFVTRDARTKAPGGGGVVVCCRWSCVM